MWPTSPKTSGLLVLPFFLLLLALHAPQAQGRPSPTYLQLFQEIEGILNKPPVPSEVSSRDRLAWGREGLAVLRPTGLMGFAFSSPHRTP